MFIDGFVHQIPDIDPAETLGWIRRYFGGIRAGQAPPKVDLAELR